MQSQLASTTAQVQELSELLKQAQRSVAQLIIGAKQGVSEGGASAMLDSVPPLQISIRGKERQMKVDEVICMPVQEYDELWADYMHELRLCFHTLEQQPCFNLQNSLHRLTFEAIWLRIHSHRLTSGAATLSVSVTQKQHAMAKTGTQAGCPFDDLLVMLSLSEQQINDIMFLRRMYFAKRRSLDAQRTALISRMQEQAPNPVAHAARTSAFAAELRENAAEDFKFHQKAAAAVLCGVLTMQQAALVLVHTDPGKPIQHLFNYLAEQKRFPSAEQMLAGQHEATSASDWAQFWAYSDANNPDVSMHVDYMPIHTHKPAATPSQLLLY